MNGDVQSLMVQTDWDSLKHSYGSASRVPEYLLALTSRDKAVRVKNYWHLDNGIVCQGDLYESAYHSIRVLIAMLEARFEHGRSDLYKLLVELAYGNAPLHVTVRTFHGREMPLATACKDELRKGIKVYSLDAVSENPTVAERANELLSLLES